MKSRLTGTRLRAARLRAARLTATRLAALIAVVGASFISSGPAAHGAAKVPAKTASASDNRQVVLCGAVLVRPTTVPLLCGSDLALVQQIKWKSWGVTSAVGTGTLISSAQAPQSVTITFDQSIRCVNTKSYFGRLSVVAKKPLPKGVSSRVQLKTCAVSAATDGASPAETGSGTVPPTVRSVPVSSLPEGNGRISFAGMDNVPLGIAITSLGDRVNFTKNVGACLVMFVGDNVRAVSMGTVANGKVEELSTSSPELSTAEGIKVGLAASQVNSTFGARAQNWSKGVQVKSADGATTMYVTIQNGTITTLTIRPVGQQPIVCG